MEEHETQVQVLQRQIEKLTEQLALLEQYYEDIRNKHKEKILNLEDKNKKLIDRLNKKYGKHLSNLEHTNPGRYQMEKRKLNKVIANLKAFE